MKIKAAMTILNKECEFLGMNYSSGLKPFDELISDIELNKESYPLKTIEAYNVYEKSLEGFRVRHDHPLRG